MAHRNDSDDEIDAELYRIIHELVSGCLFGRTTSSEKQQLMQLLEESPQARRIYYAYVTESALLRDFSANLPDSSSPRPPGSDSPDASTPSLSEFMPATSRGTGVTPRQVGVSKDREAPVVDLHSAAERLPLTARTKRLYVVLGALSAVLLVAGLIGFWSLGADGDHSTQIAAGVDSPSNSREQLSSRDVTGAEGRTAEDNLAQAEQFVARIMQVSSDAVIAGQPFSSDFLLRLRRNEELVVERGVVEVEFYSGARINLHGPARFVALGEDHARLELGKLTGLVDEGDFRLEAGVAEVIDLGTEFGVSVSRESAADILVFDGEVDVRVTGQSAANSRRLGVGMSANVQPDGQITADSGTNAEQFVRVGSTSAVDGDLPPNSLSLIDIIAGGDGAGSRLSGAVDPMTGQWDRHVYRGPLGRNKEGDAKYRSCSVSQLIDGVFVPHANYGRMQIDSAPHYIPMRNIGIGTYGPIWVRRNLKGKLSKEVHDDFWGTGTLPFILQKLEKAQTGIMGLHPNVGITFDLTEIAAAGNAVPIRFQATSMNLDNAAEYAPQALDADTRRSADIRIFVDGVERYSRLDFARQDGAASCEVDLRGAKYMTILSLDAGNSNLFDHVILSDPQIILEFYQSI